MRGKQGLTFLFLLRKTTALLLRFGVFSMIEREAVAKRPSTDTTLHIYH